MARVLSGVKPTGKMTLGNYIGSFRNFASYQDENETYIFIADLHALTKPIDPQDLRNNTYDILSFYLAAGLDPEKCCLFKQSDIAEVALLNSIIINYIYMGELSRMTQYKDFVNKNAGKEVGVGLFAYPVLMAADLFMYDTELCPVGEDQRQHVELAHDIARRINNRYKENILSMPKAITPKVGKRIMNLSDPTQKMSKSVKDPKGEIYLADDMKTVRKKFMSAKTDTGCEVKYDVENKPGISNLLQIYAAIKEISIEDAEKEFVGCNYGTFKGKVADAVIAELEPFQQRYLSYRQNEELLNEIFAKGAAKAKVIATEVLERVKKAVGLI
ncbi:MAG TPA: tryptophan--tRNA ligase [Firmicutes bacterium]|nr:tryptophan--tRNA ligase [Clostridium sp. CAG:288]HAR47809.1 tryptophan--tRNA ligase [Bacillota bacterium]HAX00717.1 tryptophan--tRNA ligase [Bacillota bacterium]